MTSGSEKVQEQMRQGLAVLCVSAALVLLGLVVGGDVGEVLRAGGIVGALLGFAVLAVLLVRRRT